MVTLVTLNLDIICVWIQVSNHDNFLEAGPVLSETAAAI